jgi:hypothetical protein
MPRFHVYRHPVLGFRHSLIGFSVVKDGFSWPGFFFLWIWAFLKKLWSHGVLLAAIHCVGLLLLAALGWLTEFRWAWVLAGLSYFPLAIWPPFSVFSAVGLGLGLFAGFKGNRWIEVHLALSGYEYLGFTWAANQEAAIARAATGSLEQDGGDAEPEDLERFLPEFLRTPRIARRRG